MASAVLTAEQLAAYRASANARGAARRALLDRRRDRAWGVARRAADLLRSDYGATRVVVFGSLCSGTFFDERSDIDLAVWGIAYEDLWRASGAVAAIDTTVAVDLIRSEEASSGLLEAIEKESTAL
jgi:uncharacterized protein